MAYTTEAEIKALIPAPELIDALDDDGDGQADDNLLTQIITNAGVSIDALLANRFEVPFTDVPTAVKRAALVFACCDIYRRRRVPGDKNPWQAECDRWMDIFMRVRKGEEELDGSFSSTLEADYGGKTYIPGRTGE